MIILDLEYDPGLFVWLTGLCIVDQEREEYHQFFAEERTKKEEKRILRELTKLLSTKPKHQIVTYGAAADLPQLKNAWFRQGFPPSELDDIERRHIDLYAFILRNFRLPLDSYSLKDIEEYLGFERKDKQMDGLLALLLYNQYLREKNISKKLELKQRLLVYNREDLDGTLYTLSHLKLLAEQSIKAQPLL